MNRVAQLEKIQSDLTHQMDLLGVGIFDVRFMHKSPQSLFLRRAMALDVLLARARAVARGTTEKQRQAELAGIRIFHRETRKEMGGTEKRLLHTLRMINSGILESIPTAGGVN